MVILNATSEPKHEPDPPSVAIPAAKAVAEVKEKEEGKVVDLVRSVSKANLPGPTTDCASPRASPL